MEVATLSCCIHSWWQTDTSSHLCIGWVLRYSVYASNLAFKLINSWYHRWRWFFFAVGYKEVNSGILYSMPLVLVFSGLNDAGGVWVSDWRWSLWLSSFSELVSSSYFSANRSAELIFAGLNTILLKSLICFVCWSWRCDADCDSEWHRDLIYH